MRIYILRYFEDTDTYECIAKSGLNYYLDTRYCPLISRRDLVDRKFELPYDVLINQFNVIIPKKGEMVEL